MESPKSSARINALVVEDSSTTCFAIKLVLESDPCISVVASATYVADAVKYLHDHHVDVITLDLNLPDGEGVDLVDTMIAAGHCGVIVISGNADLHIAARARGATATFLKAGLFDRRVALVEAAHRAVALPQLPASRQADINPWLAGPRP